MFYASDKKKRPKEKVQPLYNNRAPKSQNSLLPTEIEAEMISA